MKMTGKLVGFCDITSKDDDEYSYYIALEVPLKGGSGQAPFFVPRGMKIPRLVAGDRYTVITQKSKKGLDCEVVEIAPTSVSLAGSGVTRRTT